MDADANVAKELVDAILVAVATTHVSGLFYFFYAAVTEKELVLDVEMTAAYGSSFYCSAAVDLVETTTTVADALTAASKSTFSKQGDARNMHLPVFMFYFFLFHHIFFQTPLWRQYARFQK